MINMSITSSYVILFVIAARFFLKKAPKLFSYALWAIPFLRLVFPFSFESTFSLVSINREIIPENIVSGHTPPIQSAISTIDGAVNYIPQAADSPLSSAFYLPLPSEVNPIQRWISLGSTIWIIGLLLLLVLSVYSTIRLSRRLKSASLIRDNIYSADHIETAFVFGLLRPRIFLPCNLSQTEALYVIRHEEIHIRRLDHLVKFLASLIVSIHWFNPLVWLAFYLMGVDMELSCDESVINEMGCAIRKDYSSSLLSLSIGKRRLAGSPLAFSENNTKGRIKNILNYEKPKFWIVIVSIIFVAVLAIGLLSNRPQKQKENPNASLSVNAISPCPIADVFACRWIAEYACP
jgi:beta-lactamase regulating signal transducer with metallopeptidase domain